MPIRFFTIGQVAEKTGLPAHTIRYWEKEFSILEPIKNRNGRRKYSERDLEIVEHLEGQKEAIDQKLAELSNTEPWASEVVYLMQIPGLG